MSVRHTAFSPALLSALGLLALLCNRLFLQVTIPKSTMEENLRRVFPISRTYAGVAEVTLHDPSLLLGKTRNRLTVGLNAVITPRGLSGVQLSHGAVLFSAGLAFDSATARFLLDDVTVDSVGFDPAPGVDQRLLDGITEVIRLVAQQRLEGAPVHQLDPRDIQTPIAKLFLRRIEIRPDAIVVTLSL